MRVYFEKGLAVYVIFFYAAVRLKPSIPESDPQGFIEDYETKIDHLKNLGKNFHLISDTGWSQRVNFIRVRANDTPSMAFLAVMVF